MTEIDDLRADASAAGLRLPDVEGISDARIEAMLDEVVSAPAARSRRGWSAAAGLVAVAAAAAAVLVGVTHREPAPRPLAVGTPTVFSPVPQRSIDSTGEARDLEIPLHPSDAAPVPEQVPRGGALSRLRLPSLGRTIAQADRIIVAQVLSEDHALETARLLVWSTVRGPKGGLLVVKVHDVWQFGTRGGLVLALVDDSGQTPTLLLPGTGSGTFEAAGLGARPGGSLSIAEVLALRARCREDDSCPSR